MAIVLDGSTGVTMPAGGLANTAGAAVGTTDSQTLTNKTIQGGALTRATAVASTSGTSIDFTGIPSWVKRITVMFDGVSTNGASIVQMQVGASTFSTSGYKSTAQFGTAANQYVYATSGFIFEATGAAAATTVRSGLFTLTLIGSNTWVGSGIFGTGPTALISSGSGGASPALSGALDRVRITTVNGTDTFDAGTINIMYEG